MYSFKSGSSSYNELDEKQRDIYKYEFYSLIEEYHYKPIFAPPFSLIIYIYAIFYDLCKKCKNVCKKQNEINPIDIDSKYKTNVSNSKEIFYNMISNWILDQYFHFHGLRYNVKYISRNLII